MKLYPLEFRFNAYRLGCGVMAAVLTLQPAVSAFAANHPNSSIQNVNVLNMTANVDWDYDGAAPVQASTSSPGVLLTKAVVEKQILREMARKMYLMTEGRHRVGNVYVYKNSRFKNSVDLQLINIDGRSNATTNAWQAQSGTSNNYLSISGSGYMLGNYANVLAHEMGHYIYGLLDEYREDPSGTAARTAAPAENQGGPAGFDTTKITIMHMQDVATRFSTAEDYAGDKSQNNTAQTRIFATDPVNLRGGSAWEVLTRDPANDPPQARASGNRIFFDAFKNMTAPAGLKSLTKYSGGNCVLSSTVCGDTPDTVVSAPAGGTLTLFDQRVPPTDRVTDVSLWQSGLWQKSGGTATTDAADGASGTAFENFKVIWADSANPTPGATAGVSRNAIIINRAMPAATFQQGLDTAVGLVQRAVAGSELTVVATPLLTEKGGAEVVLATIPVDTGKNQLVAAIRGLTRIDDAPALQPAYTKFIDLISAGRKPADSSEVFFITDNSGVSYPPDASFATKVRADRVPFTITELALSATAKKARKALSMPIELARALGITVSSSSLLQDLARASGGHLNAAKTSEEAIKEAQRASDFSAGKSPALVADDTFALGAKGGKGTLSFNTTSHDKSVTVKWYFEPHDGAKVSFKLTPPLGSPSSALSAESDVADGYAVITLPSGSATGNWTAEVNYSDAMTGVVSVEALTDSSVQMTASISGGSLADRAKPLVLQARVAGDFPVAGATVTADVIDLQSGAIVLLGVVLKDDGLGEDSRPNDGLYTLDLSGKLPVGEYKVTVSAVSNTSTVFQPNQVFIPGAGGIATVVVGIGLVRLEQLEFNLEAGATGVATVVSTSPGANTPTPALNLSSSGGCTVVPGQNDAGLLVLLAAALVGMALRRRTPRSVRSADREPR